MAVEFAYSRRQKIQTFHVKDDNGKWWLKMHVATFLNTTATADVLAANNNDLISVDTRAVHFAWLLNYRLVLT